MAYPLLTSGRWGTLTVETIGRIRRERLLKGKSIKEIARDLMVSRNTVRKSSALGGDGVRVRAGGAAATEARTVDE